DDSWILPASAGLVPPTAPTVWMAKQRPSASIISWDELCRLDVAVCGTMLCTSFAWFGRSVRRVDMGEDPFKRRRLVDQTFCSLPPCGGGLGWGVATITHSGVSGMAIGPYPPPQPSPARGEGERQGSRDDELVAQREAGGVPR